jgi:hypothetical protein
VLGCVGRDAAPVVDSAAAAIGDNMMSIFVPHRPSPRRQVSTLPNGGGPVGGGSDVHPRTLADRFQALENGDVLGVVRHARQYLSKW